MQPHFCPFAITCALRKNLGMQAALNVWKSFYCEGSFARCERHKLAIHGQEIPDRLLPNGRMLDLPEDVPVIRPSAGRAA